MVKFVYIVFKSLSKLLLNVIGPVILLIEVLIRDLVLLLNAGVNKIIIKNNNTSFAHCLEHDVTLVGCLSLLHDVCEGLVLHVIHIYLLGELEDNWLIDNFSITVQ